MFELPRLGEEKNISHLAVGEPEFIFNFYNPIQSERAKRASSSLMGCEELVFPDWSPMSDNPIQSKRASSSIMECEEFFLPDWSPLDDPA